jgi:2-keto-4-pentenoate hydratase/2-oxohepta-3-ene-1,7-dioic acid hydratase in catechol pathway
LPGDVIATGTPAGVGIGFKPPRYLAHGDAVRCEIGGIGALENRIVDRAREAQAAD